MEYTLLGSEKTSVGVVRAIQRRRGTGHPPPPVVLCWYKSGGSYGLMLEVAHACQKKDIASV